jgi:hypothetical protein
MLMWEDLVSDAGLHREDLRLHKSPLVANNRPIR